LPKTNSNYSVWAPVIYTCEKLKFKITKTHCDTNHHLTIHWDTASPQACDEEFTATIRATIPYLSVLTDVPYPDYET